MQDFVGSGLSRERSGACVGFREATQLSRRSAFRIGGLGLFGLGLPDLLRARASGAVRPGTASHCILLFMHGGPSHLDTFDPKPDAPSGIRGEFGTIDTAVPGVRICEHLPLMARTLDRVAIIRSVHHAFSNHNPGTQIVLSGRPPSSKSAVNTPSSEDFPAIGSVVAWSRPAERRIPSFVQLPELSNDGPPAPGQFGGFLGQAWNPFVLHADPNAPSFDVPELRLPAELAGHRLDDRRALFHHLNEQASSWEREAATLSLDPFYQQAFDLLTGRAARAAFALDREDPRLRDRYGRNKYGQSALLARRLIEAGVRFVTVNMGAYTLDGWDTHKNNFNDLKDRLCPPTDRYFSVLLEDLASRGLLATTLVVWMGEFGRSPKVGDRDPTGRDHWPHCYSVVLAGGPIQGGQVYGSSDKIGAHPHDRPVTPGDIAATIYKALGLDPHKTIYDRLGRPLAIAEGQPLDALGTGA